MKKSLLFFVSLLVGGIGLLTPLSLLASALPFFGGFDVVNIPCTCAPALSWDFFIALHYSVSSAGPIIPTTGYTAGAFAAPVTPVLFSNYYIRPETWVLGTYTQGAGVCLIGVEPYCVYMPNYGLITPETGVSPTI